MAKPLVYIVIYSLYHHVYKLSLSIKEGLELNGVEVKIFQVQETLSDEILSKMQAPSKPDLPVITVDKLSEPNGILFGLPTRFGTMPAQMKALLDASGALWARGELAGKFAGTFFSTASQHGGQETTALTAVTYFAHHGMMYVPFGYGNSAMASVDEVIGGSAYGCGTISDGDGSRQPSQTELIMAHNQGEKFAEIITTFARGSDMDMNNEAENSNWSTDPTPAEQNESITNQINENYQSTPTDSNVTAGVGGVAAAAAASSAIHSNNTNRSSFANSDRFQNDPNDTNEIISLGDTTNLDAVPSSTNQNITSLSSSDPSGVDSTSTGNTTTLNPIDSNPTSDPISGTNVSGANETIRSNVTNKTSATAATNVTIPSTGTNPTTIGSNSLGDTTAGATGATNATPGVTTSATDATASDATGATAGATASATASATAAPTQAKQAAQATQAQAQAQAQTTQAPTQATNKVKESLVKPKAKEKPKKKRWFCC